MINSSNFYLYGIAEIRKAGSTGYNSLHKLELLHN